MMPFKNPETLPWSVRPSIVWLPQTGLHPKCHLLSPLPLHRALATLTSSFLFLEHAKLVLFSVLHLAVSTT